MIITIIIILFVGGFIYTYNVEKNYNNQLKIIKLSMEKIREHYKEQLKTLRELVEIYEKQKQGKIQKLENDLKLKDEKLKKARENIKRLNSLFLQEKKEIYEKQNKSINWGELRKLAEKKYTNANSLRSIIGHINSLKKEYKKHF